MSERQARVAYVRRLADCLGQHYLVDADEILARTSRRFVFALSRHIIAHRLYEQSWTITEIAEVLGIDHSTVCHGRDRVKRLLRTDQDVRDAYKVLPAYGEWTMFSEPALVALYRELTEVLAHAQDLSARIDAFIAQEAVPARARRTA